jgi:hypothetical protein
VDVDGSAGAIGAFNGWPSRGMKLDERARGSFEENHARRIDGSREGSAG